MKIKGVTVESVAVWAGLHQAARRGWVMRLQALKVTPRSPRPDNGQNSSQSQPPRLTDGEQSQPEP